MHFTGMRGIKFFEGSGGIIHRHGFSDKLHFVNQDLVIDQNVTLTVVVVLSFLFLGTMEMLTIRDRKKTEVKMERMAYHDSLTDLPNRYKLNEHLKKVITLSERNNQKLAVMYTDLDRFKMINDTYGYSFGDELLKQVADRLTRTVQNKGILARQSGDEFIILFEDIDEQKIEQIAQRIIDEFTFPFEIKNEECFTSLSIGISIYPTDGEDVESLIKKSDAPMYLAKQREKNNFHFYDAGLDLTIRKVKLENGLRKAIENNEFCLNYQPQVEIRTGQIKRMEALIRWYHPVFGLVEPLDFIPLAEETGLIIPIGKWVMVTACKQNKAWQERGYPPIIIAVNVSVRQIANSSFIDDVKDALLQSGLDPEFLEVEITESLMQNTNESMKVINQSKAIGVKVSIDDFGTGYSSLSVLHQLSIDYVKIDKSFVGDVFTSSNTAKLLETIIHMGTVLNFELVAEGIESEEQLRFLQENGCRYGQGFLFSKPLPANEVIKLFEHQIEYHF